MKGKTFGPRKFRLETVSEDQTVDYEETLYTTDVMWFKLMEGDKRGLEFAIPVQHPECPSEVSEQLQDIQMGESVRMKWKSVNKRMTSWVCTEIDD